MSMIFRLTKYDTIIAFLTFVCIIGASYLVLLLISSFPFKKLISVMHKHPRFELEKYYFYYQKATAYRLLYTTHLFFEKAIKIISSAATFITVYCAIDNNAFILLFSLIVAMSEIFLLSIPLDTYSRIYVQAARKLEYVLNEGDDIKEPELSKKLNNAYMEAEKIIENGFQ